MADFSASHQVRPFNLSGLGALTATRMASVDRATIRAACSLSTACTRGGQPAIGVMIRRTGLAPSWGYVPWVSRSLKLDLSLFRGRAGVPCQRHPLGCVRFRPDAARFKPRSARGRSASGSDGTGSLRSRTTAVLRAFRSRLCPAKETAPEGADAGTTPAGPPGRQKG
jgi:hypothetical protein